MTLVSNRGKKKSYLTEDGYLIEEDKRWSVLPYYGMDASENTTPDDEVQEVIVEIKEEPSGKNNRELRARMLPSSL